MKCEEIMKQEVVFVREDESAETAAQLMRTANVGFLPIADGAGRIIGAVTDRDLAMTVVADNRPPDTTPVREAMSEGIVACLPSDELTMARDLMAQNAVYRVVVLESDGTLRGVVSASDIADYLGPTEAAPIAEAFHREVHPF